MLKEKHIKKSIVITDLNSIKPLQAILINKQRIKIKTGIAKEIHHNILYTSLQKICLLSNINKPEEYILLKFNAKHNPYHDFNFNNNNHDQSNDFTNLCTFNNEPIEYEDSFEINYNQQPKPIIIDTDDIKGVEEGYSRRKSYKSNKDNNEVNEFNALPHSRSNINALIVAHYLTVLLIWELLYCIMIIIGISIWVHLVLFVINVNIINSFYIFYAGVIGGILMWIGACCLWCFIKDDHKEIYMENTTMGMITAFVMTIGAWVIIPTLEMMEKEYVYNKSWYWHMYSIAVVFEMGIMMMNFTMEAFYREYGNYREFIKRNGNGEKADDDGNEDEDNNKLLI